MRIIFILAMVAVPWLAGPAFARAVEVTSGEHEGFTRIVLNFFMPIDWEFGRTLDGYRFRPKGLVADYALDPVFEKIGKSRLAAISENPATSDLDIGFACSCHAIAFEFRPGIIVIDLRDGPPPNGSSFETPLPEKAVISDQPSSNLPTPNFPQAKPLAFNWLDRFSSTSVGKTNEISQQVQSLSPQPSSVPDLQPLRDQLLRQLSRGATDGVIELSVPEISEAIPPKADINAARVALGELNSVDIQTARALDQPLAAMGDICIAAEQLAFSDWASEWEETSTTTDILAQDMNSLVGEFDLPDPESVARAVKARLFMGFGVEARQILESFPTDNKDQAVWRGLSFLLDGEVDAGSTFIGQAQCDTPAALWAVLADAGLSSITQVNTKAVLLAFSRLPPHLRKLVGPTLIERFVTLGDDAAASGLRDSILRASGEMPIDLPVAEARIALAKGDPVAAEGILEDAVSGASIASAKALIARVDARISQDLPIDTQTVDSLDALQNEMRDTQVGPEIASALIRAEAASGNFSKAFAKLADMPNQTQTVWRALAKLANDSALLLYAAPPPNPFPTNLDVETVNEIGGRLLGLGLPQEALQWLQKATQPDELQIAQAFLALRDAQSALLALETSTTAQALGLRAEAQRLLGNAAEAASILSQVGQDSARLSALAQAKDWASLAKEPESAWSSLANGLNNGSMVFQSNLGPLAAGEELAEQSASTRAEVEKLLLGFSP